MPYYKEILANETYGARAAERLLALRRRLDQQVPKRTLEDTLLLATWNLREFDSPSYGRRSDECLLYIAEIVSRFDLVAIQEVKADLDALRRLRAMLGAWWDYVVTDVTEGTAGNGERLAYLYDSRKVKFSGMIGEVVLPDMKGKAPVEQLARTPLVCGFKAGWYRFELCTVHVYYGESKALDPRRLREIQALAQLLAKRAKKKDAAGDNLVLLGDFNIFARTDATYTALTDAGFVIPKELESIPSSNVPKDKHYDQIAFLQRRHEAATTWRAGVFDFFKTVYRDEDEGEYAELMGEPYAKARNPGSYYRSKWRTYQMSDHLPMWVELRTQWVEKSLASRVRRA